MAGFPSKAKGNKLGEPARNPQKGTPLDKNQVSMLLTKHLGNVSKVADTLGCSRHAIQNLLDRDPELAKVRTQARERFIDNLEQGVWERALDSNDTTLQLFLLKTQGRSRGYDQDSMQNAAKDIATAAFDFIVNKSKNPAEHNK